MREVVDEGRWKIEVDRREVMTGLRSPQPPKSGLAGCWAEVG
jgi:hypothetical protein